MVSEILASLHGLCDESAYRRVSCMVGIFRAKQKCSSRNIENTTNRQKKLCTWFDKDASVAVLGVHTQQERRIVVSHLFSILPGLVCLFEHHACLVDSIAQQLPHKRPVH